MTTRTCKGCDKVKPLEDFSGHSCYCKPCKAERHRKKRKCKKCDETMQFKVGKKGTLMCKPCKALYDKERKERKRTEYHKLLHKLGCSSCDENHPGCLEVHHLSKEFKRYGTGQSQSSDRNVEDLDSGVAIVLCASCHMIFHSHFGGRSANFPKQTKDSTVEIIDLARRILP